MKGHMSTELGNIVIDSEAVAQYAGTEAMQCFGIVGMAAVSMKDGIVKLLKKDSITRGINVAVSNNKLTLDFNGIINLNETGAFLFEKLQNDCEKADLLKAMLDEYEVSEEKASADIDTFIQKLREADVLE